MRQNFIFRCWYYFRTGWGTYFAFISAAINTLTVTYYLAIDRYPILKELFPNFVLYVIALTIIAVPILVLAGYVHYKRSAAFRAEADLNIEINPYQRRMLVNTEIILALNLKLTELLLTLSKNDKLTEKDTKDLSEIQNKLSKFIGERTYSNNKDMEYFNAKFKL